ncbi:MAG: hypothetical protein JXA69_19795 [Phycisphaerae bacterium]|nr:hypothetical protein [Phycisphaerae bacterium]
MIAWFKQLDDLLRGRKTAPDCLAEGRIELSLRRFAPLMIVLGATYGFFMGWYAILGREVPSYAQLVASTVKIPALFLLTLIVTFPSLYVFNALVGCRLSFIAMLRLLVGAIVVNVAVAGSLGPILGFFTLSTRSYPFMIVLNVALLAVSGLVGLTFLLHTLRRLAYTPPRPAPGAAPDAANSGADAHESASPPVVPGPLDPVWAEAPAQALGQARGIFQIWVIIYGLVGAQMGWLLRPFIGSPSMAFEWFRERQGNFFQAIFHAVQQLFDAA